jgi:hypothetical protein
MVWRAALAAKRIDGRHPCDITFCSHLAMHDAPGWSIQERAGHGELSVTQRYMRLSPGPVDTAIRLREPPGAPRSLDSTNTYRSEGHSDRGENRGRRRPPEQTSTVTVRPKLPVNIFQTTSRHRRSFPYIAVLTLILGNPDSSRSAWDLA